LNYLIRKDFFYQLTEINSLGRRCLAQKNAAGLLPEFPSHSAKVSRRFSINQKIWNDYFKNAATDSRKLRAVFIHQTKF